MIHPQGPMVQQSAPAVAATPDQAAWLRRLVWRAFLLRAALAIVLHFLDVSRWFAPDEVTFFEGGRALAWFWGGDILVRPFFGQGQPVAYYYLNALSVYLFDSVLPLKLVNALLGALSCRLAYNLANGLLGSGVARRTALFAAFLPSLVLWSSLNIRDMWVVYLILLVCSKSVALLDRYSHSALFALVAGIFLVTLFRPYLVYAAALPPIVALLTARRGQFGRGFVVAMVVGIAIVTIAQHGGTQEAERVMDLETLVMLRQGMTHQAASAFGEGVDISTPANALRFLPVGLAYFLFSPFPWQITSPMKMSTVPEMALIYWLTPAMLRGLKYIVRHRLRACFPVLLLTSLLAISYALGSGNVGTLYRHRSQAIIFLMLFASVGLEVKQAAKVSRRQTTPLQPTRVRSLP
jgi:hypothetical protein